MINRISMFLSRLFSRLFWWLGCVVFILMCVMCIGIWRANQHSVELPEKMVLTLALHDGVVEQLGTGNVLAALSDDAPPALSLTDITQTLYSAANDSRVKGLVVSLQPSAIGLAQIQELRDAIKAFKRGGKFAVIYTQGLGGTPAMGSYWLATAFDQIWLSPLDELPITGFGMAVPFGKDLLDKLGIKAQLLYHGTYKGAHETYTRNNISPAQHEELQRLLSEFSAQFVADVSRTRHITPARLKALIKQAPLSADDAVVFGLADAVGYIDEFENYMDKLTRHVAAVDFELYAQNLSDTQRDTNDNIAVIYADGTISDAPPAAAMPGSGVVSAGLVTRALNVAAEDKDFKAIILRVDSPGGSPAASELINRAIILAKAKKPVVVSMGNLAASGGYWIAAPATAIIAQPATITGSIGVFGGKVSLQGLWQKLGVNWANMSTANDASLFNPNQDYSAAAKAKLQASLDRIYAAFIERVAKGRKLNPQALDSIAQGRVWTGEHAQKLGLVDHLGGMQTAIAVARQLAKINSANKVALVVVPQPPTPFEQFRHLLQQTLGNSVPSLPNFWSLFSGATHILAVY